MAEVVALRNQVSFARHHEVEALEYREGSEITFTELGSLEEHEGRMWMVCGIFAPESSSSPWVVAHLARDGDQVVLRRPLLTIDQARVTRVHPIE